MTILTIEVAGREAANRRFTAAMAGQPQGAFLSFETPALLFQVLTARRWDILQRLQQRGPLGLRALARDLGVDAGNLTRDIKPLKAWGLVEDGPDGLVVPYDEIRMAVALKRAA